MSKRTRNIIVLASGLAVLGLLPGVLYHAAFGGVSHITPGEAKQMLVDRPESVRLVDVRPAEEFAKSHLRGAVGWPSSEILLLDSRNGVPGPLQGKTLLLICQAGSRSVQAARRLRALGLTDVFNVREGLVRWIADAENPVGREFDALVGADGTVSDLPEKRSTFIEQLALVVSSFVFKPVYMLVSLLLALFIWRKKAEATDLRVLAAGLFLFALGEICCFINYNFFQGHSYVFDYLHSFGMALTFSFMTFAAFEAADKRLIHFSQAQDRCAFLALCRQCYKSGEAACRLFRIFLFLAAAGFVLTAIPLTAHPVPVSYNTRIFGTFFNFSNTIPFQLFEIRYCPLVAALLFAAAGLVLMFHQRRPSPMAKVLFAGGAGFLGFSFFRLFLFAPYADNVVWQFFWEEATEIIFIAGLVIILWLFRKGLFPKTAAPV
jgi:rhodanese-related sulfurtransferase